MKVVINEIVNKYDVVVNQTTKKINVNIISQPKQIIVSISPLGPRGFKGETIANDKSACQSDLNETFIIYQSAIRARNQTSFVNLINNTWQ